jgi:hypothetical protein
VKGIEANKVIDMDDGSQAEECHRRWCEFVPEKCVHSGGVSLSRLEKKFESTELLLNIVDSG